MFKSAADLHHKHHADADFVMSHGDVLKLPTFDAPGAPGPVGLAWVEALPIWSLIEGPGNLQHYCFVAGLLDGRMTRPGRLRRMRTGSKIKNPSTTIPGE